MILAHNGCTNARAAKLSLVRWVCGRLATMLCYQILLISAAQCNMDVKEYTEQCAQDPTFYGWIFPELENIGDYGIGMTEDQEKDANDFIASL